MKTTKSASLKIRKKLCRNRKSVEDTKARKHASNQIIKNSKKQNTNKKLEFCDRGKNLSANLSALKSTPLVSEIMRIQNKHIRPSDTNLIGKVKTIIIKMENIATEIKNKANASSKIANNVESTKSSSAETKKENEPSESSFSLSTNCPSIIDSDGSKKNVEEVAKVSPDKNEEAPIKSIEGKNEVDGLIPKQDTNTSAIREQREPSVEHSTDHQEITIADQVIKVDKKGERDDRLRNYPRGSSSSCANRTRRASFELKRMMFERPREQLPRRDSVESALRHFDSIDVGSPDTSKEKALDSTNVAKAKGFDRLAFRLCTKDSLDKSTEIKGFERTTSAWLMKTANGRVPKYPKAFTREVATSGRRILPKKKIGTGMKTSTSGKLLEARDSIELTRLSVKVKSPICRRRIVCDSKCAASSRGTRIDSNEASVVKIQSFLPDNRIGRVKSIISSDRVSKVETFPFSSTKNSTADSSTQKADSRSVDVKGKKSTSPRPSSESPEDTLEQKNRPPVKSTSLKFLNHIVGETPGENGLRRKSSVSGIDGLDSTSTPLKDEKPATSMPQATRASPSLSSNTSMGTSRDQPTSSIRSFNKAKSVVVMSTPMQRLSAPHRNASNSDDSLARCKVCSRRFSVERIGFHEEICAKTAQKKRKQFDAVTHRVKGTEFESFVKKPFGRKSKAAKPDPEPELPKSNWRRKHEDFINAIRSAKQMQTHLAGGGKLSDLPPPPKSDTSDYVQCPHCSRRFNQGAASRHIPKCDTMQHNKPAQRAPVKSRR